MTFDAVIIGGSYAGLSAALQLARARRNVLVIDGGSRRNRFAKASHGFLAQDGRAPGAIAATARTQLMAYPTVTWIDAYAAASRLIGSDFSVETDNGESHAAKRLILATGVADHLPDIPGLAERWGHSVFHCPYCHGYELGAGPVGVLASSALSMHHALMLPDWGPTTLFVNEAFAPDATQLDQLRRREVTLEYEPITKISGKADIELKDGRVIALNGLFTLTRTDMASPLAEQLGCTFEQGPLGPFIQTNMVKETTVPGVFACGDAARAAGSVALAVGDGALAGASAHQSLIFATCEASGYRHADKLFSPVSFITCVQFKSKFGRHARESGHPVFQSGRK
ncbi:NAD(P)/FAD-dependent oxidoreductase [Bradyrhizobium sp. LHD-71]|uniref:NAD(P)/FAD-dependent oxidoreductase n=1 Tax=Bradyrhizobium sp. LHD-71 TaxID=3072141 RepID=UPI00280D9206|nr:NAD(P)/FAD-dependent oxidoreductase [Bradyrhizobium sp. LHD-71]MDQ8728382.1 NAD(P)/FAD-dependent oxidoreductase [Bradyrhizobium sp. LHD-71]